VTCLSNDSLFISNAYTATDHFVTGGTVTWTPTDKLQNRLAVGFDYNDADIATITPFGHLRVPLGQYFETLWNRTLLTVDLASTYRQPLGASFGSTTSIGGQMFDSRLHSTDLQADNFAGPGEPTLVSGSLRTINDVNQQRVINAGFFLQEMIAWRDRVFVTGGLRVDGNSAFGKSLGLQRYPKVSVAYAISDESFWPTQFVETMKLRGALGESGKAPGAFDAVRTYDPVAAENGQPAFTPSQVGNPFLGPERTREVEAGFDASLFGGRLGVNYTYYNQRTSDALIPVVLPPSNGFTAAQLTNVGRLNNHGQELTVNAGIIQRRALDLSGRLQFTTFNSKAGNVGGNSITIDALSRSYVREGYPVPSYFGYQVTNPDEFAAPVVDSNAFLGATFPTKIISPSLSLKLYERLTIDALGEWQLGGHLLNAIAYQNENLSSWQPCYDAQAKLRLAAAGNTTALSDVPALMRARCALDATRDYAYWVESSDFFKLRSVSLAYELPAKLLRGVRNATVVLAGRNLFTSSRYSGTDPEVADQRDNSFSRRDYYVFPTYRSFTATIRTSF
jgi:outer membrane receptor protein involved in Fe transport